MDFSYVCTDCSRTFGLDESIFRCTCGGLLDLGPFEPAFPPAGPLSEERSIFRYAAAMPFRKGTEPWRRVSMGEGLTPLVPLDPANPEIMVKVDYAMPTLSFKDRGAAVLVAQAALIGARRIVQDSSGNAGAAVAAYAARAGIACDIFVPESTSPRKVAQIEAYGARARLIPGSREDTAAAALDAATAGPASRGGSPADGGGTMKGGAVFYASHVYNPLFYQGTKTYIYEIYEALGGRLPDVLFIPVGNGTLLLGAYQGLKDLARLGLIDRFPKLVAVQAEGCAPILAAFRNAAASRKDGHPAGGAPGSAASGAAAPGDPGGEVAAVVNQGTAAEGIAIAAPMRGRQVLAALRELGGEVIAAPEAGIAAAKKMLAARGFFVETTTAATFAAWTEWARGNPGPGRVVLPLCGAGLKSL